MTTAATILDQLGGSRFLAMTGARSLLNTGSGLQFSLPRGFTVNKANKVRITLEPSDTYTVEFVKWNGRDLTAVVVETVTDVFAEDLRRVFTSSTGLDCRL